MMLTDRHRLFMAVEEGWSPKAGVVNRRICKSLKKINVLKKARTFRCDRQPGYITREFLSYINLVFRRACRKVKS